MNAICRSIVLTGGVVGLLCLAGCGWLIDPDRIVVARIGDREINRGELARVIRDMPDDERPPIQSKGDLMHVLDTYVDEQVKEAEADKLVEQGKLKLPRELAAQEYDRLHPEFRDLDKATPQGLKEFNMGERELKMMRDEREAAIDRIHKRNLGNAALVYRAQQAMKDKSLVVSKEELDEEYKIRGDEFKSFERILFMGLIFRGDENQARAQAASVIQRVQNGEKFEDIQAQYAAQNPELRFDSAIENNPAIEKFRGFWQQTSGAEPGQLIGPVFLPPSERVDSVTGRVERIGGGIVVLKVVEHVPEQQKTLEQAAGELALPIVEAKMMERLRQEYGVQTYPDKLPDAEFVQGPGV